MTSLLPRELLSIVQHLELNKIGWWERALQRIVLATIWANGEDTVISGLSHQLKALFGLEVDPQHLQKALKDLIESDDLLNINDEKVRIPIEKVKVFEQQMEAVDVLTRDVRVILTNLVNECCPGLSIDELWNHLHYIFLLPLIRSIGARAYSLVVGGEIAIDETEQFRELLDKFPRQERDQVRKVVVQFLDRNNDSVKRYVLRHLNAYYCVEASGLNDASLSAIARATSKKPRFNLLVDTNFLFALLSLRDDPNDQIAQSLTSLIQNISQHLDVRLFVAPPTIEEAKTVLSAIKTQVSGIQISPKLFGALTVASGDLSGFVKGLLKRASSEKYEGLANDYVENLTSNLLSYCRMVSVELHNVNLDSYKQSQTVVDDILQQESYEKDLRGDEGKSYQKLEHDMILWHYILDKRPTVVESPLEAQYWFVTIDKRMIAFDELKRKESVQSVPICIHPVAVIQMLQFWSPRTVEFEDAMFDSLRAPLLMGDFDAKTEEITLRIIRCLSRYENIDSLSMEAVTSIMIDEELRRKIHAAASDDEELKYIRDKILDDSRKLEKELIQSQQELQATKNVVLEQRRELDELKNRFAQMKTENESSNQRLALLEAERNLRAKLGRFNKYWIAYPTIVVFLFSIAISWICANLLSKSPTMIFFACVIVSVLLWLVLVGYYRDEDVRREHPLKVVLQFRRLLLSFATIILLPIILDLFSAYLQKLPFLEGLIEQPR